MKTFLFTLFCLTFFSVANAQQLSTSNKKAEKLFYEADALFKQRNFDEGMAKLADALKKDPAFTDAWLKIAAVHMLYGEKDKAKDAFLQADAIEPESMKLVAAYSTIGTLYYADGDYQKALIYAEKVLKLNPNNKNLLEEAEKLEARAKFGIEAMKKPVTFQPKLMSDSINQFYIHAYPVLTADQNTLIFSKRNGLDRRDDEDVMISKKKDGEWSSPASISPLINTQFNEGASTMSADGKTLVFVSCNRTDGVGSCDLYISYLKAGEWSQPENMGAKVNSNVWDSEPTLSADGRAIYFASERRGGIGKEDIWVTYMDKDGNWTIPVNLGEPVNTPGREVSPFIHANSKTLYFSSDTHLGMGGFDIFLTNRLDSVSWTEPKNLSYPVNTHASDASVFITADSKKGFYSRYDKLGNQLKSRVLLYEFDVPSEIRPEKISTYATGTVRDAETKKPLKATINLYDLQSGKVVQSVQSDAASGEYLVVLTEGSEYALYVDENNYLFKSQFFDFEEESSFNPVSLDVYLDPLKKGKGVVLNNVFFPTNEWTLEEKSKTELEKIVLFLKTNPNIRIELSGHTDNVGTHTDNMKLSLNRAKSVYDYIVSKGIPSSRLTYKGYGETQAVAENTSEEGRKKNRRIEFKIL